MNHRLVGTLVLACTGVACRAAPAMESPPPGPRAPSLRSEPVVTVAVAREAEGIRAVFDLPRPMSTVRLQASPAVRRDAWRLTTARARLAGDTVTSDRPLRRFEIWIPPDSAEVDRVYPSVHRVGRGVAIYGPALVVAGIETRVVLRPGPGEIAIPEVDAVRGYAYLGPADTLTEGDGFQLVAGESAAPWLVEVVRDETAAALAYYRKHLARAGRRPTILISADSPGPIGYRGDASDTAVISLRFFDPRWKQADPAAAAQLAAFVWHEAFHLWNGQSAAGVPAWLHEGGAEYAAIVAAVDTGALTQESGIEQVSRHLGRCRAAVGDRSLVTAELSGRAIYSCGVALEWVADVEARASSQGRRDVFAIWRDLLERGAGGGYSLDDLRAVTGPTAAAMLDEEGPGRWDRVVRALSAHGPQVTQTVDDDGYRAAALQHLMAQHCTGGHGFFTEATFLRLDTRDTCGPLSGNPEVVAIGGKDLFRAPEAAFRVVRRACQARGVVTLQRRRGKALRVACARPLERPVGLRILSAPALAR